MKNLDKELFRGRLSTRYRPIWDYVYKRRYWHVLNESGYITKKLNYNKL